MTSSPCKVGEKVEGGGDCWEELFHENEIPATDNGGYVFQPTASGSGLAYGIQQLRSEVQVRMQPLASGSGLPYGIPQLQSQAEPDVKPKLMPQVNQVPSSRNVSVPSASGVRKGSPRNPINLDDDPDLDDFVLNKKKSKVESGKKKLNQKLGAKESPVLMVSAKQLTIPLLTPSESQEKGNHIKNLN